MDDDGDDEQAAAIEAAILGNLVDNRNLNRALCMFSSLIV